MEFVVWLMYDSFMAVMHMWGVFTITCILKETQMLKILPKKESFWRTCEIQSIKDSPISFPEILNLLPEHAQ